jgi:hypothetical protein
MSYRSILTYKKMFPCISCLHRSEWIHILYLFNILYGTDDTYFSLEIHDVTYIITHTQWFLKGLSLYVVYIKAKEGVYLLWRRRGGGVHNVHTIKILSLYNSLFFSLSPWCYSHAEEDYKKSTWWLLKALHHETIPAEYRYKYALHPLRRRLVGFFEEAVG